MSEHTGIAWTDATWNPIRGCSRVSPGCMNCYAERIAARFSHPGGAYDGLARRRSNGEAQWTGEVRLIERHLYDPLRWKAPRRIFVNSMSDLFHEQLDIEQIALVFAVMGLSHWHTHQALTKRAARLFEVLTDPQFPDIVAGMMEHISYEWTDPHDRRTTDIRATAPDVLGDDWPLANVWLGVSVENQAAADERIPLLLKTPAAIRFLSCEPLLGPVDLTRYIVPRLGVDIDINGEAWRGGNQWDGGIRWVIVGGESGTGYRPMDLAWLRDIVEQCKAAGVPVFVKQDSEPLSGKQGRIPDELWIREMPTTVHA